MPALNDKPGSSSKAQHKALILAGHKSGMDVDAIRTLVGGSLRALSAADNSSWITKLGGGDLPNPPGQKPKPYAGRKATPGTARMITPDHIEQIARLGVEYFSGNRDAFWNWLHKNFNGPDFIPETDQGASDAIRLALETAQRAGEVIRALKTMHNRREIAQ